MNISSLRLAVKRQILLLLTFVFTAMPLAIVQKVSADAFALSGSIVNSLNGQSLVGANVSLYDVANTSNSYITQSLSDGSYSFGALGKGTYQLTVSAPMDSGLVGYHATIDVYENTNFDVRMKDALPSTATFSGKFLIDGIGPNDFFVNSYGQPGLNVFSATIGTGTAVSVDPATGYFNTAVTPGNDYQLRVNFLGGPGQIEARGLDNVSPLFSVPNDVYRYFNIDTVSGSFPYTLQITD